MSVDRGYINSVTEDLVNALGSIDQTIYAVLEETRRGQEPLELTEIKYDNGRQESALFIMPHAIVAFGLVTEGDPATWVHVADATYNYLVVETPQQIASMVRRGGSPLH